MEDVVIVDAARSAVGRKNGTLGLVHPSDTLGPVMMSYSAQWGLADTVDQIIGGCINKLAAQGMNITRTAWLSHGVQKARLVSLSILSVVHLKRRSILQRVNCVLGWRTSSWPVVENMSRLPIGSNSVGLAPEMGKPCVPLLL